MAYQFKPIKTKYKNRKVEQNGIKFDSAKEAARWKTLNNLQQLGVISELRRQQKFVLIPAQRIDGRLVERECSYIADFVYVDTDTGRTVVEDVKGYRNTADPAYRIFVIKRKLMLQKFGIQVKEI